MNFFSRVSAMRTSSPLETTLATCVLNGPRASIRNRSGSWATMSRSSVTDLSVLRFLTSAFARQDPCADPAFPMTVFCGLGRVLQELVTKSPSAAKTARRLLRVRVGRSRPSVGVSERLNLSVDCDNFCANLASVSNVCIQFRCTRIKLFCFLRHRLTIVRIS